MKEKRNETNEKDPLGEREIFARTAKFTCMFIVVANVSYLSVSKRRIRKGRRMRIRTKEEVEERNSRVEMQGRAIK